MDRLRAKRKTPQAVAAPVVNPIMDPRKAKALQFQANRGVVTNFAAQQNTATVNTAPVGTTSVTARNSSAPRNTGVRLITGANGQKSFSINFSDGKTGSSAAKADTVTDGAGNVRYVMRNADGSPAQNITKEQYDAFWQTGQLPTGNVAPNTAPVTQVAGSTPTGTNQSTSSVITPAASTTDGTTSGSADLPAEIPVPSDAELEAQFFSSSRNKQLEEQKALQDKRNALEADLLAFEQDQQLQQNREIASRNAQTAQALTGGVGNFGGGNIGLSAAIQANGIKALDDEVRANRLEVRDLIQRQDEIAFNLDAQQQAELDNYVSTKKSEIAAANQEAYTRWKDNRTYNFDVQKEQNENLKWLKDYDLDLQIEARQQRAQQSTEYTNTIANITSLFEFGQDFFGKNQTTDQWLGQQLSEYGIQADENTFTDDMAQFEKQLDMLTKFTDLPPSVIPMLKGIKNAELGLADTATLSALADAIKQDNYQKILDTASAKAIAEGQTSIFGGGGSSLSGGGSFNTGATGMRTDRHNNPTAMTTDVARSLGLVEGVDYVAGDQFPNNPNLRTARFLGDPVQTTIKALDTAASDPNRSAFFTQKGQQRWTYIGIPDQEWLSYSPQQKQQVIAKMYQTEGGNGSLLDTAAKAAFSGQFDPSLLTSDFDKQALAAQQLNLLNQGYNPQLPAKEKISIEQNLRSNFDQYAKDSQTALRNLGIMRSALKTAEEQIKGGGSLNAASQAIITTYNKILDPTSVVREAEYSRTGEGQSLLDQLSGQAQRLSQGGAGVTIQGLRDFTDTAAKFISGYENSLKQEALRVKNNVDSYGLNINNILPPNVAKLVESNSSEQNGAKVLSPAMIAKFQDLINKGATREQLIGTLRSNGYDESQINQFTFR